MMHIVEPTNIKRYTELDLPYWRYLPKYKLHPSKSSNKIHIPTIKESKINLSEDNWCKSVRYLYAIDLFNNKYYWELHEVLEKLWLETGKNSFCGIFIQGIIQISVALLKDLQNNSTGYKRLAKKAIPKIQSQSGIYLGVNVDEFIEQINLFSMNNTSKQPIITLIFE